MRWLVVCLIIVGAASPSSAKHMVRVDPPVVRYCATGHSWQEIDDCIVKRARTTPQVIGTVDHAKLVRLQQTLEGKPYEIGVVLYIERASTWTLSGMFHLGNGDDYELLRLAPLTINRHTGYQIDVGVATPVSVTLDGATPTAALRQLRMTLYCAGGGGMQCPSVVTSCDVLVHGKARWSFHAMAKLVDDHVDVGGDRSLVWPSCSIVDRVELGWPT